eukprot:scaffold459_cov249-Pinguiococcus_pyrenoidosus.AAC.5
MLGDLDHELGVVHRVRKREGERVGHHHRNAELRNRIVEASRRSRITSGHNAKQGALHGLLDVRLRSREALVPIRFALAHDVAVLIHRVGQTIPCAAPLLLCTEGKDGEKQALAKVGRRIIRPNLPGDVSHLLADRAVILDGTRPGNQADEGVLLRNAVGPPLLLWNSVGQRKEGARPRRFRNAPLFHSREHRVQSDLVDVDVSPRDAAHRRPPSVDLSRFQGVAEHPRVQLGGDPDVVPSRMPLPPLAGLQRIIEGPEALLPREEAMIVKHR